MSEIITAVFANKVVRVILAILLILLIAFGLYEAGKYAQRTLTNAINEAKNEMLVQMQKSVQDTINNNIGNIQTSLDSNMAVINKQLKDNQNAIEQAKSGLDSLPDVWLRVDGTRTAPSGSSSSAPSKTGTVGSDSNGTYYAKLPTASLQFLKGESYRADQCAVSLTKVQGELADTRQAFQKYMDDVTAAMASAKVSK